MQVSVEQLAPHTDPRGAVWEPIAGTDLRAQQNCHVVITLPGGIRGNHYHQIGTEIAIQTGPALVKFRDETGTHRIVIAEGEVVRFVFPPGCAHAMSNNGLHPNVLVAFNTRAFDPDDPNVFPELLIEAEG